MFLLKSQAFKDGGKIPEKYAEKSSISPPLYWENIPGGTNSLALAVTDPDVPAAFQFPRVLVHWMIYNIPVSQTELPEGISPNGNLPSNVKELNSDFVTLGAPGYGKGYGGPWPPDAAHRYVFTLYALKIESVEMPDDADIAEFAKHVLPQTIISTSLVGYYGPATDPLPL